MKGMSLIVKQIAKFMAPALFVLGSYVVLHGHITAGGGFAGGVLIAGSFALIILAYGLDEKNHPFYLERSIFALSAGLFLFITAAVLAMPRGGVFFQNIIAKNWTVHESFFSSGLISLCEIAIGILVSAALFLIFFALVSFKKDDAS